MALFQYPKSKHSRRLAPATFRRYQSYKRYLQTEFSRVCVYCRQPDSNVLYANFSVDHYRPKGLARFASLKCVYDNLYYCCSGCNSRKSDYWPADEKNGPYVVNPCDHDMASHVRFNARTGRVDARSPHGEHMEELLQLNDKAFVDFRLSIIAVVESLEQSIAEAERILEFLKKALRSGDMAKSKFDREAQIVEARISRFRTALQMQTGELPTPPLPRQRNGIKLL